MGQPLLLACKPEREAVGPSADLVVPPLADRLAPVDGGDPADGVRFGHPPAAVGEKWAVAVFAESRSDDPQGGEQLSTYASDYEAEVLAVDGPAPSRVRLRFTRNTNGYQGAEKPTAIDGKEYVVDARAPHVRDPAGAQGVSTEEAQRVLDVFPDLGARARVDQVLPVEAMRIGERRDDLAAAILRVIHPRAWTLASGSATLVRTGGGDGVFEVSLDASSEGGLRMKVHGEARVRLRDARLTSLDFSGSYAEADASPAPAGTFRLTRRVRDR
ncbi:MAG: hypothetical protein KF819_04910 [Labilithrix sp.]|nr:hypothetical protein [Labilithrix sp.]